MTRRTAWRFRRWAANGLTAATAVLAFGFAGLWVRSYCAAEMWSHDGARCWRLSSARGRLLVERIAWFRGYTDDRATAFAHIPPSYRVLNATPPPGPAMSDDELAHRAVAIPINLGNGWSHTRSETGSWYDCRFVLFGVGWGSVARLDS